MDYDLLVIDIDGVIWLDGQPIIDNIEAVREFNRMGINVVFLTNNSTKSRRTYSMRLRKLGLDVTPNNIVNSGYSASLWLRENYGRLNVLMIGEEGLAEELINLGHSLVTSSDYIDADAVVVGLDRHLTYSKLDAASKAVRRGSLFIATNRDNMYPTPAGLAPGAGSIVAFLEVASGRGVDFEAGKPNTWMLEAVYRLLGGKPNRIAVIGDRVDTDMMLAINAGVDGILVMTGVSAARGDKVPGGVKVVRTLKDLI